MFQIIDYAPLVLILYRITLPRATHGANDLRTFGAKKDSARNAFAKASEDEVVILKPGLRTEVGDRD